MLETEKIKIVEQIAAEIAQKEGCKLYDLEFVGSGNGRVLRIYIDKDSQLIDIEDCVNVSKAMNLVLDAKEDLVPGGAYSLEVSSPGVDRQLKKPWHFEQAVGQKIHIKLNKSLGELGVADQRWLKCKQTDVVLKEFAADAVTVELENAIAVRLPIENIEKAKVIFEVQKNNKNNQKNKR